MALVARLRSDKQSRWEVQLGQALSDFEKTLTSEQRASFLANQIHSSDTAPTIRDVMNITAEVDRLARRDKKGSHQCFGPRLTRFLEVVQQYASIGDVLVGGSQNLIACGVWSLVRITLLTACKFSSYLERVSRLFMDIGKCVPQIQDIANLYPDSKVLHGLVAEYFLGVIKLCQRLMSLCKQSVTEQFKSFFCDGDAIGQDNALAKSSMAIYERLQIEHAQTSSSGLSRLNSLSSQKQTRQAQKDHYRLLDACSTYNYMSAWKRTRKIGYSTWDFCKTEYDAWCSNPSSSTVILRGKLGAGKSVLLANMVDDLNLKQIGSKVIYFFCKEDDAISLDSRTIIGCLCRQLLQLLQPRETDEWAGAFTHPDSDDLLELLRKVLPPKEKVFIILDGIEGCDLRERNEILAWIRGLQDYLTLALVVSCRIDASGMVGQDLEGIKNPTWVTLPDDRPEISNYIKDQLAKKIRSGQLGFRNPNIQLDIEESLVSRCQGMFLWVHLQLESICQEQTDDDILSALSSLPRTLPDLFHDILCRHHERSPKYQAALLKVLSTALRPLHLRELEEVLSVVPGVTNLHPDQLVNNIRAVLASCGSLVVIDEEQLTVHFVHHSVHQYLTGPSVSLRASQESPYCFPQEDAQRWMGDIVVTYLSWDRLQAAVASTQEAIEQPIDKVPRRVLESTVLNSLPPTLRSQAWRFSPRYFTQPQSLGTTVLSLKLHPDISAAPGFHFRRYAEEYWLHHTHSAHESSQRMWKLFTDLASKHSLVSGALLWNDRPPGEPHDETSWSLHHSHTAMFLRKFETLDHLRLFHIKLITFVPVLDRAIKRLCEAQAEMTYLIKLWIDIMAERDPELAEPEKDYVRLGEICHLLRAQLRGLRSGTSPAYWIAFFDSFVDIGLRYGNLRWEILQRYRSVLSSISEQLNEFEPALQVLYEAATWASLKRHILLAMYAMHRAASCLADRRSETISKPTVLDMEVKALILSVTSWKGFPITKVGHVKEKAELRWSQRLEKNDNAVPNLDKKGYLYTFCDYLLFISIASDRAFSGSAVDNKLWALDWWCRLEPGLSLTKLLPSISIYQLQTFDGSSIRFEFQQENCEEWITTALPSVSIEQDPRYAKELGRSGRGVVGMTYILRMLNHVRSRT